MGNSRNGNAVVPGVGAWRFVKGGEQGVDLGKAKPVREGCTAGQVTATWL